MAGHLVVLCTKSEAECQRLFGETTVVEDTFQDYYNLSEFIVSSGQKAKESHTPTGM